MINISSAEGQRFAQVATEITEAIRRLGPSPIRKKKPWITVDREAILVGLHADGG